MKKWLYIGCLLCMLMGCENINNMNPVPNVPVNYTLNIESEYPTFTTVYQTMTITKKRFFYEAIGYSGLLIWIDMYGYYHAADLCCPNCLIKNKPVTIDGLYAVCPTCGEQYDLSYGFAIPTKGFTQYPLQKYQATLNNSVSGCSLRIIN